MSEPLTPSITAQATLLLVKDVNHSIKWYEEKLGFTAVTSPSEYPGFAIIERDGHYIMFSKADPNLIKPNWKIANKTCNIDFWVSEVDKLYQEFINNGATIDYTLYLTPWRTKEFGINDPDEYDISFGEIIK